MAVVAFNVRLPWTATGERGPLSSNTWHMDSGSTTPSEANAAPVADALIAFYGTDLDGIWSPLLSGVVDISASLTAGAPPHLPFGLWTGSLTPESQGVPPESTLNISYKAARVVGVPSQRFRGTLHLGPLAVNTIDADGRATSTVMGQLDDAVNALLTALDTTDYAWKVGSVAHGFQPITKITLNNDLGIVRRRNLGATVGSAITP